jgi:hypothetical protein
MMQVAREAMLRSFEEQHKMVLQHLDEKQYAGSRIKNVWVYNFEQELDKISRLIQEYPYIAFVSFVQSMLISFVGHRVSWHGPPRHATRSSRRTLIPLHQTQR